MLQHIVVLTLFTLEGFTQKIFPHIGHVHSICPECEFFLYSPKHCLLQHKYFLARQGGTNSFLPHTAQVTSTFLDYFKYSLPLRYSSEHFLQQNFHAALFLASNSFSQFKHLYFSIVFLINYYIQ